MWEPPLNLQSQLGILILYRAMEYLEPEFVPSCSWKKTFTFFVCLVVLFQPLSSTKMDRSTEDKPLDLIRYSYIVCLVVLFQPLSSTKTDRSTEDKP